MGRPDKYKEGYVSVTEITGILDKGLQYWYGKYGTEYCTRVAKESQRIGKIVHSAVERYLDVKDYYAAINGLEEREATMASMFVNWIEENKINKVFSEEAMYSDKYKICGTPDLVASHNNKPDVLYIDDWKTDSTPKKKDQLMQRELSYNLQCAGYALLYEENFGKKIDHGFVVRVPKDPPHQLYVHETPKLTKYKKILINLREVYKELKGI